MPVPAVAEWEWLNWKFPRPVRAGDTVYATWTLTQKRAPVGGSPTAIVVWRVDVYTAGGVLCAEGEVGASVIRTGEAPRDVSAPGVKREGAALPVQRGEDPSSPAAAPAARRRRRRRPAGDGAKGAADSKAAVKVEAPVAASTQPANPERAASGTRRRRRRRSPGSTQARNGDGSLPVLPAPQAPQPAPPVETTSPNPLTRAIRRLRRP